MRWFKHLSDARNDEVMSELIAKFGPGAYGLWWMILEIIAAAMTPGSDKCSATYPRSKWLELCSVYHKSRFDEVVEFLTFHGKLQIISEQSLTKVRSKSALSRFNLLTISCPNLLKFRDEYSRKSGQSPSQDTDDINTDIKRSLNTLCETALLQSKMQCKSQSQLCAPDGAPHASKPSLSLLTSKKKKLTGWKLETFLEFWEAFADKRGKAAAAEAWRCIPDLTAEKAQEILDGARRYATGRPHIILADRTPKMAQGWLTDRRWEDDPTTMDSDQALIAFLESDSEPDDRGSSWFKPPPHHQHPLNEEQHDDDDDGEEAF